MLTNEMKSQAVIAADHGDLEIARFLRVAISFVHQILKELEKENNNVMSVSKQKKNIPCVLIQWEHPNLFIKLSRQLMKTEVNQWGQLQKVACVWKDNQKECSRIHSIQILRDEERSIYFWKIKRKPFKQNQKTFKQTQKQEWVANNLYDNITPNIWPPNSPDLNPLDYVWRVVENIPITPKTLQKLP